jgi:hypothetical protein
VTWTEERNNIDEMNNLPTPQDIIEEEIIEEREGERVVCDQENKSELEANFVVTQV